MSYELRITFYSRAARDGAIAKLRASPLINYSAPMSLSLKDPALNSTAQYDIGFSWIDDDCDLSADLLFKSDKIYQQISFAIESKSYVCIDECDEEVTLEEVFRKV